MKTLLKIAISLSLFGFALTTHAQSYDMLDIVKLMDKPAKQKTSKKKAKQAKNSGNVEAESAIPAAQIYSREGAGLSGDRIAVSADGKLFNILPKTGSSEELPSDRQGELQHHNKQRVPAIADPRLHRIAPSDRVD